MKINRLLTLALNAGAAIAAYRICKFGADDTTVIQSAASTDAHIGVSTDVPAGGAGDPIDLVRIGLSPVEYGGSVTRGDLLTSDANGKAVTVTPKSAVLSAAITAITKANPGAVTAAAHGLSTGDRVAITDVGGMVEVNNKVFKVTVVDVDHFTIGVDSTGFTTYTAGGTVIRVAGASTPIRSIGVAEESGVLGDIGSMTVFPSLVHGS
ncbi:MAG TPA: ubiquitin-activating E1 FCCH domain-containing protein [Nevskiaceae bacterium]|nr:ubiquitin-activating E1 FCCH domain-containing protein [Nevskiaceae bacterium]